MKANPGSAFLACLVSATVMSTAAAQDDQALVIYLVLGQSNAQGHSDVFRQTDYWFEEVYGSDPDADPKTLEATLEDTPDGAARRAALAATGEFGFPDSYDSSWATSWMNPRNDVFGVYWGGTVGSLEMQEIWPNRWPASEATRFTGPGPMSPGWGANKTLDVPSEGEVLRSAMGPELGMARAEAPGRSP